MFKLYLDPGHGGSDPGAIANGLKEKDLTLSISKRIRDIMANEYIDVAVKMSRTGDTYPSLSQRVNDANNWGANYFLAIHINAGGGTGFESYVYKGVGAPTTTYQNAIHAEIMKEIGMKDRGKKQATYQVIKDSNMPAMLTENGFINNSGNAAKMKDSAWVEKVARGHVNGLEKAFNLKRKVVVQPVASSPSQATSSNNDNKGTLYKVQVGAFTNKANADKLAAEIKAKGYPAIVIKD